MSLKHLFWDSCLFIRYLIGDTSSAHFDDIARFIDEAKIGARKTYFSTLTYAERQEHFKGGDYGALKDFFEDLGASFIPIEPNPNILINAGQLRSASSINPGDPKAKGRVISTPDAIMLTSCLFARDALGINDIVLHSTDEGKSSGPDGKCIPIIGFEKWFPERMRTPIVTSVCSLLREKPNHPEPTLSVIVVRGNFPRPHV
jgi:hypothetical protein